MKIHPVGAGFSVQTDGERETWQSL